MVVLVLLLALNLVKEDEGESSVDVVMPIAFTFPNLGKLMALLFIPFSAWFVGSTIDLGGSPEPDIRPGM